MATILKILPFLAKLARAIASAILPSPINPSIAPCSRQLTLCFGATLLTALLYLAYLEQCWAERR